MYKRQQEMKLVSLSQFFSFLYVSFFQELLLALANSFHEDEDEDDTGFLGRTLSWDTGREYDEEEGKEDVKLGFLIELWVDEMVLL